MQNDTASMRRQKLCFLTATLIFGTIGLVRRYTGVSSAAIACCRGLLGGAFLALWQRLRGKRPDWPAVRKKLLPLLLSGAMIGFNWMLLFESYRYTTVAVATLCYYMAPVLLIAASPLLFGETLTAKKLVCVLLAVAGMALVSGVFEGRLPQGRLTGVACGLGAAVLYASVMAANKKLSTLDAYDKTVVQLLAAGAVMLPYLALSGEGFGAQPDLRSLALLLVLCVVHTGLPYAMYFGAMSALPAQSVALMSYLDPVTALLLSALVLHEPLTPAGIVGAVLVLGAAVVSELPARRQKRF